MTEKKPRKPVPHKKWKEEYADDIYSIIANGGSSLKVARKYEISSETAWNWLNRDRSRYQEAMEARTSLRVEGMYDLFEDLRNGSLEVAVYREMKDTIKWTSGRESQKMYSDYRKELGEAAVTYATYLQTLSEK